MNTGHEKSGLWSVAPRRVPLKIPSTLPIAAALSTARLEFPILAKDFEEISCDIASKNVDLKQWRQIYYFSGFLRKFFCDTSKVFWHKHLLEMIYSTGNGSFFAGKFTLTSFLFTTGTVCKIRYKISFLCSSASAKGCVDALVFPLFNTVARLLSPLC